VLAGEGSHFVRCIGLLSAGYLEASPAPGL
jgi:hypothetical protein